MQAAEGMGFKIAVALQAPGGGLRPDRVSVCFNSLAYLKI